MHRIERDFTHIHQLLCGSAGRRKREVDLPVQCGVHPHQRIQQGYPLLSSLPPPGCRVEPSLCVAMHHRLLSTS